MYKDSKIYVAGHTGLLGTALMKKLKADGYRNVIVRSHSQLDLTNRENVSEFFLTEKPEYVFLAAGKAGGIVSNKRQPSEYLHTNLAIQDSVFEAAQECGVKHLIFYGSSCCYPKICPQPMKEQYLLTGLPEETSEGYAIAKIAGIVTVNNVVAKAIKAGIIAPISAPETNIKTDLCSNNQSIILFIFPTKF